MNKKNHFERIVQIKNELDFSLNCLSKYLKTDNISEKIPEIEIDITLEKTRKLYSEILLLNRLNSEASLNFIDEKPEQTIVDNEKVNNNESVVFTEINTEFQPEEIEDDFDENDDNILNFQILKPEVKSEITTTEQTIESVQSEKYLSEKPVEKDISTIKTESLMDAISLNTKVEDFATKLQQKPISDIREAIGLAEKMQYINELFDNNASLYDKAITILNNCVSHQEALEYIHSHFDWNPEKESTISFLEIVKRKISR